MLDKIRSRLFSKGNKSALNNIQNRLSQIRLKNAELVLYGSATKGNWLGIKNATVELFPNNAAEIPQWYSNPVFTEREQIKICQTIIDLRFDKVTISGFAPFFFNWIERIHEHLPVEIIFHGTISEFCDEDKQQFITRLIQFGNENKIHRLGFVKDTLADVFKTLYGFNCYHQPLNQPHTPENIEKLDLDRTKVHIGVFGVDTFNKNLHNQVVHSLMIENSMIHVLDKSIFQYLNMDDRIVEHGNNLPREEFLRILGSMDLNLYMSYSESWGLIAYESEKMGVPCIKHLEVDYLKEISDKINN